MILICHLGALLSLRTFALRPQHLPKFTHLCKLGYLPFRTQNSRLVFFLLLFSNSHDDDAEKLRKCSSHLWENFHSSSFVPTTKFSRTHFDYLRTYLHYVMRKTWTAVNHECDNVSTLCCHVHGQNSQQPHNKKTWQYSPVAERAAIATTFQCVTATREIPEKVMRAQG